MNMGTLISSPANASIHAELYYLKLSYRCQGDDSEQYNYAHAKVFVLQVQ